MTGRCPWAEQAGRRRTYQAAVVVRGEHVDDEDEEGVEHGGDAEGRDRLGG